MAGFWDMVGKAANLLQLFGVDAITLITIVTRCYWQFHETMEECKKVEESVRMLRALLLSPAGCCWIMQQQDFDALKDADDLVRSYRESTLFLRVLRGRGMYRQLRDLRNSIDSYCGLILSINAFLLLVVQANPPPPSPLVRTDEVNRVGVPPSPGDSTDAETSSTAPPDHTHIVDISQE